MGYNTPTYSPTTFPTKYDDYNPLRIGIADTFDLVLAFILLAVIMLSIMLWFLSPSCRNKTIRKSILILSGSRVAAVNVDEECFPDMYNSKIFGKIQKNYFESLEKTSFENVSKYNLKHIFDGSVGLKSNFPLSCLIVENYESIQHHPQFQKYFSTDLTSQELILRSTAFLLYIEITNCYIHSSILFSTNSSHINQILTLCSKGVNLSNTSMNQIKVHLQDLIANHWEDIFHQILHHPEDIMNAYYMNQSPGTVSSLTGVPSSLHSGALVKERVIFLIKNHIDLLIQLNYALVLIAISPDILSIPNICDYTLIQFTAIHESQYSQQVSAHTFHIDGFHPTSNSNANKMSIQANPHVVISPTEYDKSVHFISPFTLSMEELGHLPIPVVSSPGEAISTTSTPIKPTHHVPASQIHRHRKAVTTLPGVRLTIGFSHYIACKAAVYRLPSPPMPPPVHGRHKTRSDLEQTMLVPPPAPPASLVEVNQSESIA